MLEVAHDTDKVHKKMKRVINGKMYNTETAKKVIPEICKGVGTWTDLHRKVNGEFFYAHYSNWEGARDEVEPLSTTEAKKIIGEYDGDLYIEQFGEPEE